MMGYQLLFSAFLFMLIFILGCATHPPAETPDAFSSSPYRALDTLPEGTILHLPTGIEVTEEQMFHVLAGARVVYVGETHTNVKDHQIELKVLQGLSDRFPGQVAVGMEMFQKPSQKRLTQWSRGELDEKDFIEEWYANWEQDYNYYKDILRYVRDHNIPLIALNAPDRLVRTAMQKGTENLPEDLKKELPELDAGDPYHRTSLEAIFGGHAHGPSGFDRFYKTMLIWDETMAQTVADYLTGPEGKDKKLIVFTGGFHVNYGFGVPRRAFKRLPEPYVIVLPYTAAIPENRPDLLMNVKPVAVPLYLADFVWSVDYQDLEDRKVLLGIQIEGTDQGVRVQKVMPDSTASKFGIQAGDIITSFDGQSVRKPFDLTHLVRLKEVGDHAELQVLREDRTVTIDVQFEAGK